MNRFKPVFGPELGFYPVTVRGRVTNFGITRVRGTTARHTTGSTGHPYAFLFATSPQEAPGYLVGVVMATVTGNVEVDTVVTGQVIGRCADMEDQGQTDHSWSPGDFLSATLMGDFRPALSGEPVYARAIEAATNGEYALIDFCGDPHFGLLP